MITPRKSHRADATACSKRMREGCPSSKPVPFAVFDCKDSNYFSNKQMFAGFSVKKARDCSRALDSKMAISPVL